IERRDVREPNKSAGMILFDLVHAVVDQAAGSKVWLIEARAAGEHGNVDARLVHHPHMRREIGEQRIEPVIWISVFVEAEATVALAGLHQLGRCIMMLKINNHCRFSRMNGKQEAAALCVITTTVKTQDSTSLAPAERLIRAINSKLVRS